MLREEILNIILLGDRFLNVLHSRIQNKCSALNADLYHANVIVNYNCLCGYFNENAEHYCYTVTHLPDGVLLCYLK